MAKDAQLLTSSEFAKKAGMPASKVTKLIRDGKIKAVKKSGKWMLEAGQLKTAQNAVKAPQKSSAKKKPTAKAAEKPAKTPAPKSKTAGSSNTFLTIAQFAEKTYLTEKGVMTWLKEGRLTGRRDNQGEWQVDAANLEVPDVKRLLR